MDQPKKEVVHSSFEQVTAAFFFFCVIFVLHVKVSHASLYNNYNINNKNCVPLQDMMMISFTPHNNEPVKLTVIHSRRFF